MSDPTFIEVPSGVPDSVVRFFASCLSVFATKGADYARKEDRLANFREAASAAGITMQQAWSVYAVKHFQALARHARDGRVESEPIEERCKDLANYAALYLLINEDKNPGVAHEEAGG